jgi:dTDP-4-dehydrorhamnose 3,5-epimerase
MLPLIYAAVRRRWANIFAIELTGESGEMLWIPPGFGHVFLALTDPVCFAYKVTDYYSPSGERTIIWNDPDIAIAWPIDPANAIVSDKDRAGFTLRNTELFS